MTSWQNQKLEEIIRKRKEHDPSMNRPQQPPPAGGSVRKETLAEKKLSRALDILKEISKVTR